MQPLQCQTVAADFGQGGLQVSMPDAVLAVLAAGVGLIAMAMTKTWVNAQPHRVTGADGTQLLQHVDGAAIDGDAQLDQARQRRAVQQVGSEDDFCMAVVPPWRKTCRQGTLYFPQ